MLVAMQAEESRRSDQQDWPVVPMPFLRSGIILVEAGSHGILPRYAGSTLGGRVVSVRGASKSRLLVLVLL